MLVGCPKAMLCFGHDNEKVHAKGNSPTKHETQGDVWLFKVPHRSTKQPLIGRRAALRAPTIATVASAHSGTGAKPATTIVK